MLFLYIETMKILQLFAPTALFKLQTETYPPPLVLGYLEKILEQNGHEVVSIDANNYSLFKFDKENIGNIILNEFLTDFERIKPDLLLISSWTYGLPFVIELIKMVKGRTRIALGGYNATLLPEKTLEQTGADIVFSGNNLFEFASKLETVKSGIIFQKSRLDHEKLPLVDFNSFIFKDRPKKFYFMSSFGCMYNCKFCSDRIIWDGYKSFSAERTIEQIDVIKKKYNPLYLAFWESNITMNKKYGDRFLELYDGEIQWFTYSRVDIIDEKMIKKMAEKNCHYVFLGVEHLDKDVLNYYNKCNYGKFDEYIESFWRTLELLHKYNIIPVVSIVIGSPKETDESLKNLRSEFEKIKRMYPETEFELSPLTLEIGTDLWNDYLGDKVKLFATKNMGLIREYSGVQAFIEKYEDVTLVPQKYLFENEKMSRKDLEKNLIEFIEGFHKN